jgi:hypothetical protein
MTSQLSLIAACLGAVSGAVVSVNLTVDAYHFATADTPVKFFTRAYNGQLPGPVIRVSQGDTLRIQLTNRLGADIDGPLNTFHSANTTNLHLHGLHISPTGASDDIFRRVRPNSTALYEYANLFRLHTSRKKLTSFAHVTAGTISLRTTHLALSGMVPALARQFQPQN